MKRTITRMAAILLAAVLVFPTYVNGISAEHAILVDAQTGRILFEKNADQRTLIASTTKIMTALIVCEQCNVLDRVKICKESVGIEGSSIYLREGETLTIQELLYGLMLHSGNDAAVALAIYCGGTVEGFVQLMNDKAHRLGLSQTHFDNPHGLDSPTHYSTARDMAALAAYAINNPIFKQTVATKNVTIANRQLRNHNKLLWRVEGADGIKTGFTKAAGRILVSSATRYGRRLIAVTMNAPDDWNDHSNLYSKGFKDFSLQKIVSKNSAVGTIEIAGGESGHVQLLAVDDYYYALKEDETVTLMTCGFGFEYAPVVMGQNAGFVYVCVDGKPVAKLPVVFGKTVEQISENKTSWWVKIFGGKRE